MKAIVTGASGFVGAALARRLGGCARIALASDAWREEVARAGFRDATVFHLAARAHRADGDEAAFRHDNVEKSAALAEAAAAGGASRFVFLSTIKVNGEETASAPFRASDAPAPADAYARSKWAAEQALGEIAARTGLALVVIRSPLVVGAGVRGNLRRLMELADTPWPLPFASLRNRRTLVQVDDLAELLLLAGRSAHAGGRLFLAGAPESVSTAVLVRTLREALGRPARLVPAPARALEALAALGGFGEGIRRLTRSLEVDSSQARRDLGWAPAATPEEGIRRMALAFRAARGAA